MQTDSPPDANPTRHPAIWELLERDATVRRLQADVDALRQAEDAARKALATADEARRVRHVAVHEAVTHAKAVNDWGEARVMLDAAANACATHDKALAHYADALGRTDGAQRELQDATLLRNESLRAIDALLSQCPPQADDPQPPAEPEPAPAAPEPQPPPLAPAAAQAEAPLDREDRMAAEVMQHQVLNVPPQAPKLHDWQPGTYISRRVRRYMQSAKGPVAVAAVAAGIECKDYLREVSDSLRYLANNGEIQRIERGIYAPKAWKPTLAVDAPDLDCSKGLTDELRAIFDRNDRPLHFADIYTRLSRPYDRGMVSSQLSRLVKKGDVSQCPPEADTDGLRWARAA